MDSELIKIPTDDIEILLKVVDKSEENIKLLTEWRNKFWDAFPEKFMATFSGTMKWLEKQVYEKDDRILFLIILNGEKIGHIGTYRYNFKENSAEIDNVVRAIRKNHPGLMEKVTKFLINWMLQELQLTKIQLKVFSDNFKAINLYERCGMKTIGVIPLKKELTEQGWKWTETELQEGEYADRYFSVMEIGSD
jgi:RimJ/RimL family protein N-acetyltransferase